METQDAHELFESLATVLMFSIWACCKTHSKSENQNRQVCTQYRYVCGTTMCMQ
jgi:hypothetical protein